MRNNLPNNSERAFYQIPSLSDSKKPKILMASNKYKKYEYLRYVPHTSRTVHTQGSETNRPNNKIEILGMETLGDTLNLKNYGENDEEQIKMKPLRYNGYSSNTNYNKESNMDLQQESKELIQYNFDSKELINSKPSNPTEQTSEVVKTSENVTAENNKTSENVKTTEYLNKTEDSENVEDVEQDHHYNIDHIMDHDNAHLNVHQNQKKRKSSKASSRSSKRSNNKEKQSIKIYNQQNSFKPKEKKSIQFESFKLYQDLEVHKLFSTYESKELEWEDAKGDLNERNKDYLYKNLSKDLKYPVPILTGQLIPDEFSKTIFKDKNYSNLNHNLKDSFKPKTRKMDETTQRFSLTSNAYTTKYNYQEYNINNRKYHIKMKSFFDNRPNKTEYYSSDFKYCTQPKETESKDRIVYFNVYEHNRRNTDGNKSTQSKELKNISHVSYIEDKSTHLQSENTKYDKINLYPDQSLNITTQQYKTTNYINEKSNRKSIKNKYNYFHPELKTEDNFHIEKMKTEPFRNSPTKPIQKELYDQLERVHQLSPSRLYDKIQSDHHHVFTGVSPRILLSKRTQAQDFDSEELIGEQVQNVMITKAAPAKTITRNSLHLHKNFHTDPNEADDQIGGKKLSEYTVMDKSVNESYLFNFKSKYEKTARFK